MSRKAFHAVVAAAVVLAGGFLGVTDSSGFWGGGSGHHRGNIPINWRVAGTIVNVQLAIPTAQGLLTPPASLIQAFVKGSPGNAQFIVVGIPNEFQSSLGMCGDGPGQTFAFNDMVITFADQSMLFAKPGPAGGWVCFQLNGTVTAVANMTIIGGTGRYEGAAGEFVGEFLGRPVGDSGALAAETGTIEGWIER